MLERQSGIDLHCIEVHLSKPISPGLAVSAHINLTVRTQL